MFPFYNDQRCYINVQTQYSISSYDNRDDGVNEITRAQDINGTHLKPIQDSKVI